MPYQPNPIIPESMPVAIVPVYSTPTVNHVINLHDGSIKLEQGTDTFSGNGTIRWEWLPRPALCFTWRPNPNQRPPKIDEKKDSLRLIHGSSKAKAIILRISYGSSSSPEVSGIVVGDVEAGDGRSVKSVLYHIVNFRDYHGERVRNETGTQSWPARSVFEAQGWRVTIDKIQQSTALFEELEGTRGFAITHTGVLEKINRRTFSAKNSAKVLSALSEYLSFCRGAWVAPILAVGFDKNGAQVWQQWQGRKIEQWRKVGTWFNGHSDEGLSKGFPGFHQRWQDAMWNEPIALSFHWYVEANMCSGGVEGSIILAQAAFELLAWTLLVEHNKSILPHIFANSKQYPAAEKLRMLLRALGLSTAIPTALRGLRRSANEHQWKDGPQALTEIRNALVHSSPAKRRKVFDAPPILRHEASRLSIWYLELILLKIFGYAGKYSNRVSSARWSGDEVEAIP
jgi:hypothetical protein